VETTGLRPHRFSLSSAESAKACGGAMRAVHWQQLTPMPSLCSTSRTGPLIDAKHSESRTLCSCFRDNVS